ncbi:aminopeptidase P family N-terminal domain-containing protein [Saccharopolyspora phatthalungensis]|uniref:Xaa-Pro aminopeptidase n=1 Tax=Saccharopolyspora phatthalungensis TaxID=664693 RepID=A0A840QF44_9PSEU|nr:aminopeptidase P family N-terminal domain-containing protein [Saccharopolyspora phatthalungensis]MBB5157105.1 Xaa-Pro aminopeptidase [Saccharopolyspora phatthalungensis]
MTSTKNPPYADIPRIRRLLAESGLDAIVSTWPENTAYLSGFYHPDLWDPVHGFHLEDFVHIGPERTTNLTHPDRQHRIIEAGV